MATTINRARKLRRIPMEQVARRAGTSRGTIHRAELGDPNVRLRIYLPALEAVGLLDGFGVIEDAKGDKIAMELLPSRIRRRKDD